MKRFIKNLIKSSSTKFNLSFALAIVFLIIFFGSIYFVAISRVQALFVNEMHQRAELAVSSGASSIKIFLGMAENSLLLLSRNPSIVNQDTETQEALDAFALDWAETPILGAVRSDKDGKLRFVGSNIGDSIDLASNPITNDRDYFVWAETATEGDTYLGKPLIPRVESSEPQYIFPLITPIYKNGEFDGVLALAISLPKLTAIYLDPLKVMPSSRIYLMHSDGTILAGPPGYIEFVGVNYFEYMRNNPYSGSEEALQELTKAVKNKNIGKLDVILFSIVEKKPVRYKIAYSPVIYNNEHWTLGLAVPVDNVTNTNLDFLKESRIIILSLVLYYILTLTFMGYLISKSDYKSAYLDGLEEGKKQKSESRTS